MMVLCLVARVALLAASLRVTWLLCVFRQVHTVFGIVLASFKHQCSGLIPFCLSVLFCCVLLSLFHHTLCSGCPGFLACHLAVVKPQGCVRQVGVASAAAWLGLMNQGTGALTSWCLMCICLLMSCAQLLALFARLGCMCSVPAHATCAHITCLSHLSHAFPLHMTKFPASTSCKQPQVEPPHGGPQLLAGYLLVQGVLQPRVRRDGRISARLLMLGLRSEGDISTGHDHKKKPFIASF